MTTRPEFNVDEETERRIRLREQAKKYGVTSEFGGTPLETTQLPEELEPFRTREVQVTREVSPAQPLNPGSSRPGPTLPARTETRTERVALEGQPGDPLAPFLGEGPRTPAERDFIKNATERVLLFEQSQEEAAKRQRRTVPEDAFNAAGADDLEIMVLEAAAENAGVNIERHRLTVPIDASHEERVAALNQAIGSSTPVDLQLFAQKRARQHLTSAEAIGTLAGAGIAPLLEISAALGAMALPSLAVGLKNPAAYAEAWNIEPEEQDAGVLNFLARSRSAAFRADPSLAQGAEFAGFLAGGSPIGSSRAALGVTRLGSRGVRSIPDMLSPSRLTARRIDDTLYAANTDAATRTQNLAADLGIGPGLIKDESLLMKQARNLVHDHLDAADVEAMTFSQDNFSRAAQLSNHIPGVRRVARTASGAPHLFDATPAERFGAMEAMYQQHSQNFADASISWLRSIGDENDVFGKADRFGSITFRGEKTTVSAIRADLNKHWSALNDRQRAYLLRGAALEKAKLEFLSRNGVDINLLPIEDGGAFAGRRWFGKFNSEGQVVEFRATGGANRPGQKVVQERRRTDLSAEELIKQGYIAMSDDAALHTNLSAAYRRVGGIKAVDHMKGSLRIRKPKASAEAVKDAKSSSAYFRAVRDMRIAARDAAAGKRIHLRTMARFAKHAPEYAKQFDDIAGMSVTSIRTILRQLPKTLFDEMNITKGRFIKELEEVRYERISTHKNPVDFNVKKVSPGEVSAVLRNITKDNRQATKIWTRLFEEQWKVSTKRQQKLLRNFADSMNDEVKAAKRLSDAADQRVTGERASSNMRRGDEGFITEVPLLQNTILAEVQPFGKTGREVADTINGSFSRRLGSNGAIARKVDAVNSIGRLFALGFDSSVMFIQLIMLSAFRPATWLEAGAAGVRAFFDEKWQLDYLARNADVMERNPNLIITSVRRGEFTEALAPQGVLNKRFLSPIGNLAKPFARMVEFAQDYAGIEMVKALELPHTAPPGLRRAQLNVAERNLGVNPRIRGEMNAFVNNIRGLTDQRSINVSAKQRFTERMFLLAPRYNRAMAAMVLDLGRTGARGSLAREAMARFAAASAIMSIGITYANGEIDPDWPLERQIDIAMRHMLPMIDGKNNPDFMTWDVFGNRVGPGSKLRSFAVLGSRIAEQPGDLAEFGFRPDGTFDDKLMMENPAFRFMRGNSSPVTRIGWDYLTGADFLGDQTRGVDGAPLGQFIPRPELIEDGFIPIWMSSFAFDSPTIVPSSFEDFGQRATRSGAEVVGLRGYPESSFDQFKQWAEQQEPVRADYAEQADFDQAMLWHMTGGVPWSRMPDVMKKRLQGSDGQPTAADGLSLWDSAQEELNNKVGAQRMFDRWQEATDARDATFEEIQNRWETGELISKQQVLEGYNSAIQGTASVWDQLTDDPANARAVREIESIDDRALAQDVIFAQYMQEINSPEMDDPIFGYDWAERDRIDSEFMSKYGPEVMEVIRRQREDFARDLPPIVQEAAIAKRELKDYWSLWKELIPEDQPILRAKWLEYQHEIPQSLRDEFRRSDPFYRRIERQLEMRQQRYRRANPNVDVLLVEWYGRAGVTASGRRAQRAASRDVRGQVRDAR